jgi:hypothetical protein
MIARTAGGGNGQPSIECTAGRAALVERSQRSTTRNLDARRRRLSQPRRVRGVVHRALRCRRLSRCGSNRGRRMTPSGTATGISTKAAPTGNPSSRIRFDVETVTGSAAGPRMSNQYHKRAITRPTGHSHTCSCLTCRTNGLSIQVTFGTPTSSMSITETEGAAIHMHSPTLEPEFEVTLRAFDLAKYT